MPKVTIQDISVKLTDFVKIAVAAQNDLSKKIQMNHQEIKLLNEKMLTKITENKDEIKNDNLNLTRSILANQKKIKSEKEKTENKIAELKLTVERIINEQISVMSKKISSLSNQLEEIKVKVGRQQKEKDAKIRKNIDKINKNISYLDSSLSSRINAAEAGVAGLNNYLNEDFKIKLQNVFLWHTSWHSDR